VNERRVSRRSLLKGITVSASALLVPPAIIGCKAIPIGAGTGSATSGTIEFMAHFTPVGTNDVRDDASKAVWERFEKQFPNITIKWQQTAWQTIGEKYLAAWSAGSAPDISLFSPANIAQAVLLGSLEDTLPHFNTWPQADKDDYPKVWWDVGTYSGKKYIAPLLLFGDLPIYRKSMFEKAGHKTDEIRTWNDWLTALQDIVVDGNGNHPTDASFDPSSVKVWGFAAFLARGSGASIPYFNAMVTYRTGHQDVEPPDWRADRWVSDEAIESVQFITDWVTKYKIQPASTLNMNLSDADKFFASGLCAAYDFGTNTYPTARKNMQFDPLDAVFARTPTYDGKKWGPLFVNHWSMGVSSKSRNKEAAFTVLDFWLTKQADLDFAKIAGQQPKRLSSSSDPFFDSPDHEYVKIFTQAQKEWAVPDLSAPVRTDEILLEAYDSIVTQNRPVKDAMKDAAAKYTKLLESIPKDKLPPG
jgi:ABC-type glycerol-3-phosphate transport system substrate-binding protein